MSCTAGISLSCLHHLVFCTAGISLSCLHHLVSCTAGISVSCLHYLVSCTAGVPGSIPVQPGLSAVFPVWPSNRTECLVLQMTTNSMLDPRVSDRARECSTVSWKLKKSGEIKLPLLSRQNEYVGLFPFASQRVDCFLFVRDPQLNSEVQPMSGEKEASVTVSQPLYIFCQAYKSSVTGNSVSCTPTSETSSMEFVMS